jgi:hypothetical protein
MTWDVECWIMRGEDTTHLYLPMVKQEVESRIPLWEIELTEVCSLCKYQQSKV